MDESEKKISKIEQEQKTFTQPAITSSKLTIKTPERRQLCRSGVFIVNFENISHLVSSVSIVNFEKVNVGWGDLLFRNFLSLLP